MSQTSAPEPSETSETGVTSERPGVTSERPGVTEEEIAAAMGVNSVPDDVRLHSSDPDETGLTMDATGQLRPPADQV